jgi:hypothetical protein
LDPWGDNNGIICDNEDYSYGNIPLNTQLDYSDVMKGYSVKLNIDYVYDVTHPYLCPQGMVPPNDNIIEFGGDVMNGLGPWGNFVADATNIALMTNVNTGPYSINVNWLNNGPFGEWNLIGNPYSAPISCGAFTAGFPPQVNGSIHYWDNANLNYAVWAGGVGQPFIPATQGFMIEVNNFGFIGPVSVNNGMRTISGINVYYKNEINDLLILKASGNGLFDLTYIRFLEDANETFDREYDAHKLISSAPGIPQIYTTINNEKLVINALPETKVVPMAFEANIGGTYTIEAIETSEFVNVVLEDRTNGVQTDLLTGSYPFNYTTGDDINRFFVHFTPLGTPELAANSINIWANDHKIYVQAPATTGNIVVYNMMGQEVVRTDIEAGLNVIPMNEVNTYFIVKVLGSDVTETGKVFIK